MGRIVAPYAVKGWIKLQTYTEYLDSLLDYPVWRVGKDGNWRDCRLLDGKVHNEYLLASLEGVNDRDAAEALMGLGRGGVAGGDARGGRGRVLLGRVDWPGGGEYPGRGPRPRWTASWRRVPTTCMQVKGEQGLRLIPFVERPSSWTGRRQK
jgi:hypothetical protein